MFDIFKKDNFNKNMIKAILFDFDGTIAETEHSRFKTFQTILKERGIDLSNELFNDAIGKRSRIFLKEFLGDKLNDDEIAEVCAKRKQMFHENPGAFFNPMPFVQETVDKLFNEGYILAIASNAEERVIDVILQKMEIRNFFQAIVGSDQITEQKPHPETYLKCMEAVGCLADECIAIEDSCTGINSAKAAGLVCLAVKNDFNNLQDLSKADKILSSVKDLASEVAGS